MNPLIVVLILFHCAECCFFKKGIPKCPRNDEDIIPDEVAEYLARQAYRHGFGKVISLADNSQLKLKVIIHQTSLHFDCTFLRDVAPAKYLQYTCRSQFPDAKIHIKHQERPQKIVTNLWRDIGCCDPRYHLLEKGI
nr:unnamed protein product [Spirometra erinaceieuropaei]